MCLSTLSLCKVAKSLNVKELVGTLRICIANTPMQSCNEPHATRFNSACLRLCMCVGEAGPDRAISHFPKKSGSLEDSIVGIQWTAIRGTAR